MRRPQNRPCCRNWRFAVVGCVWLGLAAAARGETANRETVEAVSARLDALFEQSWRDTGVKPEAALDDARFLRREIGRAHV